MTINKRDILLIRTGFTEYFYTDVPDKFYEGFCEPGLTYRRNLVDWFQDMEIPNLVTDTIANETTSTGVSGVALPAALRPDAQPRRHLTEICDLGTLAEDCAADGQWDFLYAAAPLKVVNGTGVAGQPGRDQVRGSWMDVCLRRAAVAGPLQP